MVVIGRLARSTTVTSGPRRGPARPPAPLHPGQERVGQQGEVVAVGPGKTEDGKRVAPEVKAGDRVLYGKYSGTEVTVADEQFLILRESDVLAVISV